MIKILFLKEDPTKDLINKVSEVIEKFGKIDKKYPNEYRKSEIHYQVAYNENIFCIGVSIRTFNNISSVIVIVHTPEGLDVKSDEISNFKRDIKSAMMEIMDKCYWIEDEQMSAFSKDAYENISKAENMFRSFMLNYMIHTYGGNWFDAISQELRGNINQRSKAYIDSLTDLKDVNLDIYSLYINDLNNLVENEYSIESDITIKTRKELNVSNNNGYGDIATFIKSNSSTIPQNNIKIKSVKKTMFWEESIGKYVRDSGIFKEKWLRVCTNRNHVAHNKPIDKNMYNIINSDTTYIIEELEKAIDKLNASIQTEEDKDYLSIHDKAVRVMDLETYGAVIYSKSNIEERLDRYFEKYKLYLEELSYFNNGIKYTVNPISLEKEHIIISVIGIVTEDKLTVCIEDYYIDDSDGGESEVNISISYNDTVEKGYILFESAKSEFNEDIGAYIPHTYGCLDDSGLFNYVYQEDKITEAIRRFVNNQFELVSYGNITQLKLYDGKIKL